MDSLYVNCTSNKCAWSGPQKDFAAHKASCSTIKDLCPYKDCEKRLPREELTFHTTNCPKRPTVCVNCSSTIIYDSIDNHITECQSSYFTAEPSSHDCQGKWESRVDSGQQTESPYANHLEMINKRLREVEKVVFNKTLEQGVKNDDKKEDTKFVLNAPKKRHATIDIGNTEQRGDLQTMDGDSQESETGPFSTDRIKWEVKQILQRIQQLENQGSPQHHPRNSCPISRTAHEQSYDSILRKLELGSNKIDMYEGMAMVLNASLDRLLVQVNEIDNQRKGQSERQETQEKRIKDLEKAFALTDPSLSNHIDKTDRLAPHNGILIWKIDNFSEKRKDAISGERTSIYSPPFFTSWCGYKMGARIYLNGDGMGKQKYISLFFVIIQGQFDALLPWPFKQKVTLMLLDQGPTSNHIIDAFRPDPKSSSFQRPIRELNIASGCPLFAPLSVLQTNNYVKDDVVFIKIVVDTRNL